MTYVELAHEPTRLGCRLRRQSRGSHEIWRNPLVNCSASIPRRRGDLAVGTLNAILRQLGIARQDLDRA